MTYFEGVVAGMVHCVIAVVCLGCGEQPLSAFKMHPLVVGVEPVAIGTGYSTTSLRVRASLAGLDEDCPRLASSVVGYINDRPMIRNQGGSQGEYCSNPGFQLELSRSEAEALGTAVFLLQDNTSDILVEVPTLFSHRGVTGLPGDVVRDMTYSVSWSPSTDLFPAADPTASINLSISRPGATLTTHVLITSVAPVSVQIPSDAPLGGAELRVRGGVDIPVSTCEGGFECIARAFIAEDRLIAITE